MAVYNPEPVALGTGITLPADGETVEAADVNVPFASIADGVAYATPRSDPFTASGTWTAPSDMWVQLVARGGGGGGGGGARGNSTNADNAYTTGGAGGAEAREYRRWVFVVEGEVLTIVRGTGGTAGVGSATVDGAAGGDGVATTITSSIQGLLLTGPGGGGGGGAIRNIDVAGNEMGLAVGGLSVVPTGFTPVKIIEDAAYTEAEQQRLFAWANLYQGIGCGTSSGYATLLPTAITLLTKWPGSNGSLSTSGTNGADDAAKKGGFGGGGGGGGSNGGNGGAGGAAVAAGSGVNGSVGVAGTVNTGGGGGGGGSGGTGSSGGTGANGGAGGSGYATIIYSGPQAVVT